MTIELLEKAKELNEDINTINEIIKDKEQGYWINIISSRHKDNNTSNRFEQELLLFLKKKVVEYQNEFDELAQ